MRPTTYSIIKCTEPILLNDLTQAFSERMGVRRQGSLHSHLDCFKRAKGNIGDKFSRSRGSEINKSLWNVREELFAIDIFEYLVETVLARTLERVADESRRPTEEDTA